MLLIFIQGFLLGSVISCTVLQLIHIRDLQKLRGQSIIEGMEIMQDMFDEAKEELKYNKKDLKIPK